MAKITVYLPDQLDAAVRAAGVSVSPICQKALQQEVERVEAVAGATKDIQKVAKRLKASRKQEEDQERQLGYDLGVMWAREQASLQELRSVVELRFEHWINWDVPEEHSLPEAIASWNDVPYDGGGMRLEPGPFMEGLIAGAQVVYTEVQPLL